MKTKITFVAALLCALIFAPSVLADTEEGFYEKNHIRGFISLGGDYRGMFKEFRNSIYFVLSCQIGNVRNSSAYCLNVRLNCFNFRLCSKI